MSQTRPDTDRPRFRSGWRHLGWLVPTLVACLFLAAAVAVRPYAYSDRLLLVSGEGDQSLYHYLLVAACGAGIVLAVALISLLVTSTATVWARALGSVALLAAVAVCVVMGFFALLLGALADANYITLDELSRPADEQIVISEFSPVHDTYWRAYIGGPYVYEPIEEEGRAWNPSGNNRPTPIADHEYQIVRDEHGRQVLTFAVENGDHRSVFELVLP
jgi:hypothetical protein